VSVAGAVVGIVIIVAVVIFIQRRRGGRGAEYLEARSMLRSNERGEKDDYLHQGW
jgi:hypothetical protein